MTGSPALPYKSKPKRRQFIFCFRTKIPNIAYILILEQTQFQQNQKLKTLWFFKQGVGLSLSLSCLVSLTNLALRLHLQAMILHPAVLFFTSVLHLRLPTVSVFLNPRREMSFTVSQLCTLIPLLHVMKFLCQECYSSSLIASGSGAALLHSSALNLLCEQLIACFSQLLLF